MKVLDVALASSAIVRWSVAAVAIALVGLLGLSAFFSDLGPGETGFRRAVVVAIEYVVGGVVIGWTLRRRWYLAILEAWGPVLLGVAVVFVAFRQGIGEGRLSFLLLLLGVMPLVSIGSGLLGWRLARLGRHSIGQAS